MSQPEVPNNPDGRPSEPVFAEPWQASAFALTVALHERGLFSWGEWAETLGKRIKLRGADDDPSYYFEAWVEALERLMVVKGATDRMAIDATARSWERAAEATPHGTPLRIENDPQFADLIGLGG